MIILLDSGPLGMATNPKGNAEAQACQAWLRRMPFTGHIALVPQIVDYELRRELLLAGLASSIRALDGFQGLNRFLPLSQVAYKQAALFWATARRQGLPTADRFALDVDVILCAQAATFDHLAWQRLPAEPVVIATTNVGHLSRFADARLWQNIP